MVLFLIELISFFVRPLSHSVRLAGNMMAGHAVLKVFAAFVPAMGLLGRSRRRRPAPHILTRDQINRIMQEALLVPGLSPISPLTYHNLFGLLASTGLRISEALSLQRGDLTEDGLMIRKGKFGKSRLVPIHPSTRAARASRSSAPPPSAAAPPLRAHRPSIPTRRHRRRRCANRP